MKRSKGFTLIELAMVLIIIGLLIGIGITVYKILIKQSKFKANKEVVQTACDAIKGYAQSHYLIPDNITSLGVKTTDPYNNPLVYKYDNNYTSNNLCTFNSTDFLEVKVYDENNSLIATKDNVVFAIYSKGENRNDDTNPDGDNILDIKPYGTNNFDDIVCYLDINTLRKDVCPTPLRISGDLPPAKEDTYYEAYIDVTGGVPPYNYNWGTLPCGLNYSNNKIYGTINCDTNSTDGTLSGCSKNETINITVEDSLVPPPAYSDSKTLTLTITAQPPAVVENSLPDGQEGISYSVSLHAIGGDGNYTWNISGLPSGLSASSNTISGIPAPGTAGTYSVKVELSSCSQTVVKYLPLVINPPTSSSGGGNTGCTFGNPITVENVGGVRYVRLGTISGSFCILSTTCVNFVSISLSSTNACFAAYRSRNCRNAEAAYSYNQAYSTDSNNNCIVNYNNGNLTDD